MKEDFDTQDLFSVALYEPEIANNMGAIARTCTCFDVNLLVIEPCSFILEDRSFRRAKMDYKPDIKLISSYMDFCNMYQFKRRVVLFSPHTNQSIYDFEFKKNDILLFGRESNGVEDFVAKRADAIISIPMSKRARSLNISSSVSIGIAEAKRQLSNS